MAPSSSKDELVEEDWMSKPASVGALLLVWLGSGCGTAPDMRPDARAGEVRRIALLGDRTFPEGIAAHTRTGELFVGGLAGGEIQRVVGDRVERFKRSHQDGLLNVIGLAVDSARDRLWVCSTSFADPSITPALVVFDTRSGERLAVLALEPDGRPHFLNDVDVDGEGNAYATDSLSPIIYRAPADLSGIDVFASDPAFSVHPGGFNLNGIAVAAGGGHILASVPSLSETGRGRIFRIAMDGRVTEVALSADYPGADGLVALDERTMISSGAAPGLHRIDFNAEHTEARVTPIDHFAGAFAMPTTAAVANRRLWVVSSQLDHYVTAVFGDRGPPELPFQIVGVPLAAL
jgi:sugar lactone lactonase YvrE